MYAPPIYSYGGGASGRRGGAATTMGRPGLRWACSRSRSRSRTSRSMFSSQRSHDGLLEHMPALVSQRADKTKLAKQPYEG